jgi:dolichol kinase
VNELFFRAFAALASPREARGIASSTWYAIGILAAFALFPRAIAVSSVLVMGLCDPVAGYVGRRYGRRPFLGGTLEGSLAFFAVATLILVARHPAGAALAAALVGALAERRSWPLDDNLAVPLASGATLAAVLWLA